MQTAEINLARQAGINDAEANTVNVSREGAILSPYPLDPIRRCAYEHGVRLVARKNRLLSEGRSRLANAIRMPDLYQQGKLLPLS